MLSGDLEDLAEIVEDLEARDDVDDVELFDFEKAGLREGATAHLSISFNQPSMDGESVGINLLTESRAAESLKERNRQAQRRTLHDFEEETAETDSDDSNESSESDDLDDEAWCGRCGHGPTNETGIKIHNGHNHDDEAIVLDEEPDEEDLVEDTDDSELEDEDVDEDSEDDDGGLQYECENCGAQYVGSDAAEGCCENDESNVDDYAVGDPLPEDSEESSEQAASDGGQVALPAGLTEDVVHEAAAENEKLYQVTDVLNRLADNDVTHGQTRSFLHALGAYGDIRDVTRRGGAS